MRDAEWISANGAYHWFPLMAEIQGLEIRRPLLANVAALATSPVEAARNAPVKGISLQRF
jgi:hypothetical protein